MLWLVSAILVIIWLTGIVFNKGGLIHILLLCAIAVIVVQIVASRRATS